VVALRPRALPTCPVLVLLSGLALGTAACTEEPEHPAEPPPRAQLASLEPLVDVEVEERWRGLSAYTLRADTDGAQPATAPADGHTTLWHENGVKKGEGLFRNGKKQGPWTWWYPSGQKRWEGTYVDDHPQGLERSWFENGQLEYEGSFQGEEREGTWARWYDTGQQAVVGKYRQGQREGEFRCWSYEGELDRERSGVYADDVKVAELPD